MKAIFRLLEDDEYPQLLGITESDTVAIFMVKDSFITHGINVENYLTSNIEMTKFGVKAIELDYPESSDDGIYDYSTWEIVELVVDKPFLGQNPCSFSVDYQFLVSLKALDNET